MAYDRLVNNSLNKEDLSDEERDARNYYSDYSFCKTFGWTVNELLSTRSDYYNHFSMISNAIHAKAESERIRNEQRNKRKNNLK